MKYSLKKIKTFATTRPSENIKKYKKFFIYYSLNFFFNSQWGYFPSVCFPWSTIYDGNKKNHHSFVGQLLCWPSMSKAANGLLRLPRGKKWARGKTSSLWEDEASPCKGIAQALEDRSQRRLLSSKQKSKNLSQTRNLISNYQNSHKNYKNEKTLFPCAGQLSSCFVNEVSPWLCNYEVAVGKRSASKGSATLIPKQSVKKFYNSLKKDKRLPVIFFQKRQDCSKSTFLPLRNFITGVGTILIITPFSESKYSFLKQSKSFKNRSLMICTRSIQTINYQKQKIESIWFFEKFSNQKLKFGSYIFYLTDVLFCCFPLEATIAFGRQRNPSLLLNSQGTKGTNPIEFGSTYLSIVAKLKVTEPRSTPHPLAKRSRQPSTMLPTSFGQGNTEQGLRYLLNFLLNISQSHNGNLKKNYNLTRFAFNQYYIMKNLIKKNKNLPSSILLIYLNFHLRFLNFFIWKTKAFVFLCLSSTTVEKRIDCFQKNSSSLYLWERKRTKPREQNHSSFFSLRLQRQDKVRQRLFSKHSLRLVLWQSTKKNHNKNSLYSIFKKYWLKVLNINLIIKTKIKNRTKILNKFRQKPNNFTELLPFFLWLCNRKEGTNTYARFTETIGFSFPYLSCSAFLWTSGFFSPWVALFGTKTKLAPGESKYALWVALSSLWEQSELGSASNYNNYYYYKTKYRVLGGKKQLGYGDVNPIHRSKWSKNSKNLYFIGLHFSKVLNQTDINQRILETSSIYQPLKTYSTHLFFFKNLVSDLPKNKVTNFTWLQSKKYYMLLLTCLSVANVWSCSAFFLLASLGFVPRGRTSFSSRTKPTQGLTSFSSRTKQPRGLALSSQREKRRTIIDGCEKQNKGLGSFSCFQRKAAKEIAKGSFLTWNRSKPKGSNLSQKLENSKKSIKQTVKNNFKRKSLENSIYLYTYYLMAEPSETRGGLLH